MSHAERILSYLQSIAPRGAEHAELCACLDGTSYPTVFRATRWLMSQELIRGERTGRRWAFYANTPAAQPPETPAESPSVEATISELAVAAMPFMPIATLSWEILHSAHSLQARWLLPLLERPGGCVWFLERMGCPSANSEGQAAEIYPLVRPLRDLLWADVERCAGQREREDELIAYYSNLFRLPASLHEELWRRRSGGLRLPIEAEGTGWSEKLLRAHLTQRQVLRRARAAREMVGAEIDLLVLTPRHLLLVECHHGQPQDTARTLRAVKRLRRLARTLERRLEKACHWGLIVDDPAQLPPEETPHLLWREVAEQLQALEATSQRAAR